MSFVPDGFEPPLRLVAEAFVLEPLGPQHNDSDYAAWTSSMEHIHASPGWSESTWPRPMTLDENRADLERHARDFAKRAGFTYTVLASDDGAVIGCVYIYPVEGHDARVSRGSVRTAQSSMPRCATPSPHGCATRGPSQTSSSG